jgi:hypothetical protein
MYKYTYMHVYMYRHTERELTCLILKFNHGLVIFPEVQSSLVYRKELAPVMALPLHFYKDCIFGRWGNLK